MSEIIMMVRQVTVFLLMATLLANLLSGTEYKKYIQYAVGLMVMAMVIVPVLRAVKSGDGFDFSEVSASVEEQVRQQEERMRELEKEYEKEKSREEPEQEK